MFNPFAHTATAALNPTQNPTGKFYQGVQSLVLNNYNFEESMLAHPKYANSDDVTTQAPVADKTPASRMWSGLTVSRNAQGQDEAFAIGPDGYVWSYITSPAGHTAGRLISTGLEASSFALAKLARHRKLVIGVQGASLSWVAETGEAQPRWHAPVQVGFAGLEDAQKISQVHTLERDDEVLVGVLVHYVPGSQRDDGKRGAQRNVKLSAKQDAPQFWVAKWTGDNLYFMDNPVALDGSSPIGNEFLFSGLATTNVRQSGAADGGVGY